MSVPIPAFGIHYFNDETYFGIDLPSSSATKVLATGTNANLAWERENPREETDAFAIGAYLHALLLDPNSIETNFVKIGKIDRRTKDGKAEWESATKRAALSGARLITDEQVALAASMAASVRAHPAASRLLASVSTTETTIIGDINGLPAKCKCDALIQIAGADGARPAHILVDIKTTQSADPRSFAKDAATFGYFHQFAFYRRLCEQQATLGVQEDAIIIAVEKAAPFLCAVYRVPSVAIEVADRKIAALVERWWAVHDGDRSGYSENISELEPPRWWLIGE